MLKRIVCCMLVLMMTISSLVISSAKESADGINIQKEFYVSVDGSDNGDGSKTSPFKTIDRARLEVQKYNDNMTGDIIVNIADGVYELSEHIEFVAEDSGSNGFNVIYRGERDNNLPVISGGRRITGWSDNGNGIWSAKVDDNDIDFIRTLYVNDYEAIRARTSKLVYGEENYVDPSSEFQKTGGMYINKGKIGKFENFEDVELFWGVAWKDYAFKAESIEDDPKNPDRYILKMRQPEWNAFALARPGSTLAIDPGWFVGFRIENAYELMDEPGEFYFNKKTRILYYIPREGQDMNTAEVYAPAIERVVRFYGKGPDEKVHNIKFSDVKFAHTNYWPYEYQFQYYNQVEHPQMPGSAAYTSPGGVQLDWADNITIESCVFYGIETVGLALADGVTNSQIHGNVFADLGSGSILVGRNYHNEEKYSGVNENGPLNLVGKKTRTHYSALGTGVVVNKNKVWRGNHDAAEKNSLEWAFVDLEKPYDLESIVIDFTDSQTGKISDEEQSNFEVILSNDDKFESYITVDTCVGKASDTYKIDLTGDSQKYRYMLVKKIVPEKFAIRSIEAYTYDEKPIADTGVCSYNYISNNYIQRVAKRHLAAPGLSSVFTNNLYVDYNEIYDSTYSGMSLGYAWNPGIRYDTVHHTFARYNRIERYNMLCNDGGAIYTLCCQPGSEVHDNYFKYGGNTWGALYNDSSTGDFYEYNLVSENTAYANFVNGNTVANTTVFDTYSDGMDRVINAGDTTTESINKFMPGFISPEALAIKNSTGIQPEWEYIRDRVPNGDVAYFYGVDSQASYIYGANDPLQASDYITFAKANAGNIINNGTWGRLPWNYPIEYRDMIEYWYNRIGSADKNYDGDIMGETGSAYEMYEMREIYDIATEAVKHLSFDEMKNMCDETLKNAKSGKSLGCYPQEAIERFKRDYEKIFNMPQTNEIEEYAAVLELEKAYQVFYDSQYRADIDYVYVDGGMTEMDYENKKAVVTVGASCDRNAIVPKFRLSNNTEIGIDINKISFNEPKRVALYNREIGKYDYWTITIKSVSLEPTGAVSPSVKREDWVSTNRNKDIAVVGGNLNLYQWYEAYMDKTNVFDGEIKIKTKIGVPDCVDGVNFIVSAQTNENLEYGGYDDRNTYYNVALKGQKLEVSSVKAGKSRLCFSTDDIGFNYGEFNDIVVKIDDAGKLDTLTVIVNDKIVAHNAYADDIGAKGYFGVMSLNQTVMIAE